MEQYTSANFQTTPLTPAEPNALRASISLNTADGLTTVVSRSGGWSTSFADSFGPDEGEFNISGVTVRDDINLAVAAASIQLPLEPLRPLFCTLRLMPEFASAQFNIVAESWPIPLATGYRCVSLLLRVLNTELSRWAFTPKWIEAGGDLPIDVAASLGFKIFQGPDGFRMRLNTGALEPVSQLN